MPDKDTIIEVLKKVYDPEIPVNVYDLGFIYNIDIDGGNVGIKMTLTVPGCPMHSIITKQVKEAVLELPEVDNVEIELTFEPRWTPDLIKEDAKVRLRAMGYKV